VNEPARPTPTPPPPLEANDQLVTGSITVGWALALIVLLIVRNSLPADARWWLWTCVTGLVLGLFGLWYVPRLKRGRARAAARGTAAQSDQAQSDQAQSDQAQSDQAQSDQAGSDRPAQSAPRDKGSNTVSSTDTPGKSTMS
jgi:ABC-type nickel/cobalt efflux system permease component RcnA